MEKSTFIPSHGRDELTDTIIQEILAVRDTGETNMFDYQAVQRIAYDMDLFELVNYLENPKNRHVYYDFILHGKRPETIVSKDQTEKANK